MYDSGSLHASDITFYLISILVHYLKGTMFTMEATIAVGTVPGFAPFTMHKQESTTMFKLGPIFRLSLTACDYHMTIIISLL